MKIIYLDESGDLGFNFGRGSSQYFVITFITMNKETSVSLKRKIRIIKKKNHIPKDVEMKANNTNASLRIEILKRIASLNIEIHAIIANKKNVERHLRKDPNILYNYMVNLIMVPYLEKNRPVDVFLIADLRITRVAKGMRFTDYLKYKLFFEKKLQDIELEVQFLDSFRSNGLQAVDFVAYAFLKKYKSSDLRYYQLIEDRIRHEKKLFWHKKSGP